MAKGLGRRSLWLQVCEEYEQDLPTPPARGWADGQQAAAASEHCPGPAIQFLERTIFPVLLPGLEAVLTEARKQCYLENRRTRFNACDFLTEWLYNHNPCRVGQGPPVSFLEIPFVRDWLSKHPRPPTPLSLRLTEDEAAVLIQSYWRGYKVRVRPDVQELREWQRELRAESRDTAASPQGFCTQQEGRGGVLFAEQHGGTNPHRSPRRGAAALQQDMNLLNRPSSTATQRGTRQRLKAKLEETKTKAGREIEDLEGSMQPNSSGVSILLLSPSPQGTVVLSPTAQLMQENGDTVQGTQSTDEPAQNMQSLPVPGQSASPFSPLLSYK